MVQTASHFSERRGIRKGLAGVCGVETAMKHNNRKSVRRHLTCEAAVVASDGAWRHRCTILDVSESGARFSIDPRVPLPAEFVLSFTKSGAVSRPCCVVWRHDHSVGVRYVVDHRLRTRTTR